jgi:hypothetical protein
LFRSSEVVPPGRVGLTVGAPGVGSLATLFPLLVT